MESMQPSDDPHEARSLLSVADQAPRSLTDGLRLPTGLHPALGVAVALQIATAAYGIAQQTAAGLAVLLAGMAVLLLVAAVGLHRFRRINGVRVDGLASQVLLGTGATSSVAYLAALAAATWAAFASLWWVVAVAAVVGGAGYALGARQWWNAYRADPVAHARGVSPRMLVALAVLVCLGFVALLVVG
jgi:hypothetical protein